jgi:polyphosphate glucokinase
MAKHGFGVDVGGSGIKGAPVNLHKGTLSDRRYRVATPKPATPKAMAAVVRDVLDHFGWDEPFGCTFPAVVQHGLVRTAANVDRSWIGTDGQALLTEVTGRKALLVNDADAAGVAEVRFGAAKDQRGVVLLCTLGTGIGSAIVVNGKLVPNTELGHVELDGYQAESRAAESARERENLSWVDWSARLTRYFQHLENLFWPDLIVVGGGVSKKANRWQHLVHTRTTMVPAALLNDAGIVGAAVLAAEHDDTKHGSKHRGKHAH